MFGNCIPEDSQKLFLEHRDLYILFSMLHKQQWNGMNKDKPKNPDFGESALDDQTILYKSMKTHLRNLK